MTSCPCAYFNSITWKRDWTKFMQKRSATSSTCSSTKRAGVLIRRTATTQRVASTRIIHATFADLSTYSSTRQKTVRHYRTALGGTNARVASSATSATQQWSGCITLTSISASNATRPVATSQTFVLSITIRGRSARRTSFASNISSRTRAWRLLKNSLPT